MNLSIEEAREMIKENPSLLDNNPELKALLSEFAPATSKYHNIRTEYNGRVYDSKKEAEYAGSLDLLKRAGEVLAWFPQIIFQLQEDITYIADFVVIDKSWQAHVVDCKGIKTKEYRIKFKLFKEKYNREIEER